MNHTNYVCYRLPEQKEYIRLEQRHGKPLALLSPRDINGRKGFVFAPFRVSASTPIWLLQGDVSERHALPETQEDDYAGILSAAQTGRDNCRQTPSGSTRQHSVDSERSEYHRRFLCCKNALESGEIEKVVMARRVEEPLRTAEDPERLFLRACRLYPHQYISLVSIEEAGTWLMATPEVLLCGDGSDYSTMALAGTQAMPAGYRSGQETAWSEKNRKEQAFVARYISGVLRPLAGTIRQGHPHTVMAARLLHLRTDFRFTLRSGAGAGDVIDALHPTPAVAGIPKDKAVSLIDALESDERKYYSGFCGPCDPEGQTRLFVTLRCMEITADRCVLHAGGGIVRESVEDDEWKETEMKLNTMRDVLR